MDNILYILLKINNMKNRTLITKLRQFNPELVVGVKAELQHGCNEVGYGSGEYEGFGFSQDYTIGWNDGSLQSSMWDGITVGDVIDVLKEKTLSKISNEDFSLSPGELRNGNPEYTTAWDDEQPEEDDMPEDSELYGIMEIGDATYEWDDASSLEFEVFYKDTDGEDGSVVFYLNENETDRKPDPLEPIKKTIKKKAAKKK
jgi:hypothetical protein